MKFRKKPVVVIEAVQFKGVGPDGSILWGDAPDWLITATQQEPQTVGKIEVRTEPSVYATVFTLEGVMTAHKGDWIIRGVSGEFYLCRPDIFEATYELVE